VTALRERWQRDPGRFEVVPDKIDKYSPDQPRDEHGRWTDGGGSEAPVWTTARDSQSAYKVNGAYTPERAALHAEILRRIFAGHSPSAEPTMQMLGGGPASGKTSGVRLGEVAMPPDAVAINADDIKRQLPEYDQMVKAGLGQASAFVHEEGSELSKTALREAAQGGYNVVYDSTGDNSLANIESKVAMYRDAGFRVNADYFTIPVDTAVERAAARANNPASPDYGREVPEAYTRATYASISNVVPAAVNQRVWDSFNLWNNDVPKGDPPTKIAGYVDRGALVIADPAAWDTFLAAGKG
jgi:predicted ABC-type ATPase